MLKIRFSAKFKKDLKNVKKQNLGFDEEEFKEVVNKLAEKEPLDEKYHDHPLKGKFAGTREFHLKPDLLLMYKIVDNYLELILLRIGSHSELF